MTAPKCNCPPHSPFRWRERQVPSLLAGDKSFSPHGDSGLSQSMAQAQIVQRERDRGVNVGTIHGISRNKDAERLRKKDFHVYAKAGKDKTHFNDRERPAPIHKT